MGSEVPPRLRYGANEVHSEPVEDLSVPAELYCVDGWKRNLIRRAMQDILPPEIQWRKCKAPFSPDFYLIDEDVYIELTTMKQSLVTKKNRKLRL